MNICDSQGIFLNVDELTESNRRFNARLKDAVEVR